ncbi:GNAT family N-acetyltransferase [Microvirga subterranea]|uniref:Ribosomal protein S18 acetylase RimI-like enzyme n=1 Tax=Microvirga subterranea TaxID=186651 RepID=A0A370HP92_9HYPH|nr:GNAT family N-acetyltransferase [Microvirga subterranea]RDI60170.1 ribosomal protein S18 acetylase RimI-like enzyme [Microvirga subterranea]
MSGLLIRQAGDEDLEAIIRLHEEDELGSHGDAWTPENRPAYEAAFEAITHSSDNELFVAVTGDEVVGTFQLTFIPNLTGRGALRVKVESVKVKAARRSQGIGAKMMEFAEKYARTRGAAMLELSSNKTRTNAHRFYERLGFARSHEGFKKRL